MSKEWFEAMAMTTAFDVWLFVIAMCLVAVGAVWAGRND